MIVVDASAVVALLVDDGPVGQFVATTITRSEMAFPSLMPYEVASALRRLCLSGALEEAATRDALRDVNTLGGGVFEFEELAERVWQLRHNLTVYDAAYVALAESLDVSLLTLDTRLAAASGPRCRFLTPPTIG